MDVIDPGDPTTWHDDIRNEVDRLANLCRANSENIGRPSFELEIGVDSWDQSFEAERAFRDLIGDRLITYYHATRLLPHEDQMYFDDGLLVLSDDLRDRRLDRVIARYGDEIGHDVLEALRGAGPATRGSPQRTNRMGLLHGVTPLDAVRYGGWGMEILMTNWGGESFYFDSSDDPTIAALSALSTPSIIEAAVSAQDLCTYHWLWRIFVGRVDPWDEPWHEFSTKVSVPADRILSILHPESERWPLSGT